MILPGLPVAAFSVICPALAAWLLSVKIGGPARGWILLRRAFDGARVNPARWWLPILLISPAVAVAAFVVQRASGSGIPDPNFAVAGSLALAALFLAGALSEELGWSGFALDPLQARWGPLPAGLAVGAAWAVWHYPALLQAHRAWDWIAWWTLGTVSLRLIMVWLYNRTGGSVFGAAVVHAVSNLCWQLFPVQGSWFDPRIHGLLMAAVAAFVIISSSRAPRAA